MKQNHGMKMLGPEESLIFFNKLSKAQDLEPKSSFVGRKRSKGPDCICDCGPDSDCCGFN